jgi:hypothetical protein
LRDDCAQNFETEMGRRRVRQARFWFSLVCACCALACGSDGSSTPSAGTQTGDEGDVSTPGAVCIPACDSSQTCCARQCLDLETDARNCGKCGNACASGSACVKGACTPTP